MKVAIPVANGTLESHFGHCRSVALFDVNPEDPPSYSMRIVETPEHEPGRFPPWLKEQGVDLVIAGGMGGRAQALCEQLSIDVVTGVPVDTPDSLIRAFLAGTLQRGESACTHGGTDEGTSHHCAH